MAQTSSAAREPSMEEILASIRRIIEDSDVSRKPVPDAFAPRGEIAAFRRPEPLEAPEEKPAMMRGIFTEEPVLRGPLGEPSLPESDEEDEAVVLDAQNDDRAAQEEAEKVAEEMAPTTAQAVTEEPAAQTPAGEPEPVADEAEEQMTASNSHILSEAVERQVAEAFEDLSHAVHAGPRRSFDEIAAELLRPMLRDWLDSNLPGLVERLVREEIERVVRGAR